ncbi:MAG: sugar isomerase [Planctomycetota bacterium]
MTMKNDEEYPVRRTCCPCSQHHSENDITRRGFLQGMGGAAALGVALTGLTWSTLSAGNPPVAAAPSRRPLRVKPILLYSTYTPRPQSSWRNWGGIETQEQADAEVVRIRGELKQMKATADFPAEFLPVSAIRGPNDLASISDLSGADTIVLYAAAGPQNTFDALTKLGKNIIFFVRSKSGPHYLWYEIVSPRYLRQHTDTLKVKGMNELDVVVDDQDEILWRLRALCGLNNAMGTKILAIGGPGAWAQQVEPVTERVVRQWQFDIQTVSYDELGKLIRQARADKTAVALARRRAEEYLKEPGTTLETKREFVDNCFLLDQVFRTLMSEAGCSAITVHHCMGTIMRVTDTTACLTLTTLNDDGYLAFCESDFIVIPSGVLLAGICGKPVFLHNPTWPHKQIITLAHCTAPRKMDGKNLDPVSILTHFESDYGAAPKVEMRKGQRLTSIIPDFAAEFWQGLSSEVIENPFLPICRSQIEVKYDIESQTLAERLRGFHWMTCYGDYMREVGYALKKVGIKWENLTA